MHRETTDPWEAAKILHEYANGATVRLTLCGISAHERDLTKDDERVDCKNCLKVMVAEVERRLKSA